ncbi:hypothetical protein HDU98_002050 [Podochytrium sp. JEL0797]|nr:hypothetical protein HDU98_002050 [Podochytrium sp. JEL0797]
MAHSSAHDTASRRALQWLGIEASASAPRRFSRAHVHSVIGIGTDRNASVAASRRAPIPDEFKPSDIPSPPPQRLPSNASLQSAHSPPPRIPPPRVQSSASPMFNAHHTPDEPAEHSAFRSCWQSVCDDWWTWTWLLLTCCVCNKVAAYISPRRFSSDKIIQAWREKLAACIIIAFMMAIVTFLTVGLQLAFCPSGSNSTPILQQSDHSTLAYHDNAVIFGSMFNFSEVSSVLAVKAGFTPGPNFANADLTQLFAAPACAPFGSNPQISSCSVPDPFGGPSLTAVPCVDSGLVSTLNSKGRAFFSWDDLRLNANAPHTLMVYNGLVLNLTTYLAAPKSAQIFGSDPVVSKLIANNLGEDSTRAFYASYETMSAANCLAQRYTVGYIDQATVGCGATQFIQGSILGIIVILVSVRFTMAFVFHWCISGRLVAQKGEPSRFLPSRRRRTTTAIGQPGNSASAQRQNRDVLEHSRRLSDNPDDAYVIMLVTCYTEAEESIRKTVESLAATDYADAKKLLFVIADGKLQGKGNDDFTSEYVKGLVTRFEGEEGEEVEKVKYVAIADGVKQENVAQVYAGHYETQLGGRVPIVGIVKCGTDQETEKPGNRGKRDSQMILMKFLSSVTLQDARMTPLDFDLAEKIERIGGVRPNKYSLVLMVDADTAVKEDSLNFMVQAMKNDPRIMGLCGETRIENQRDSWVTKIQVFEYYISHHLGKAFESVFGGVTCLPGCFSMYRVRGETLDLDGDTDSNTDAIVPILIEPAITELYREFRVETLHKKNLLLLGEDRYLTTLMLSKFPRRRMIFVPQAQCETTVPDDFKTLLSQRRRWINSTIHNLLELLLIDNLCGIFCLSMKFVILLELIGTVVLPVAILLTGVLIISAFVAGPSMSLYMLLITLLLPGLLILFTTCEVDYILWMFVYLVALPVWNLVLPLYSFWHFDDFSWGDTRQVEGEVATAGNDHGDRRGEYDIYSVPTKPWRDWIESKHGGQYEMSMMTDADVTAMDVHTILEHHDQREASRAAANRSRAASRYSSASGMRRASDSSSEGGRGGQRRVVQKEYDDSGDQEGSVLNAEYDKFAASMQRASASHSQVEQQPRQPPLQYPYSGYPRRHEGAVQPSGLQYSQYQYHHDPSAYQSAVQQGYGGYGVASHAYVPPSQTAIHIPPATSTRRAEIVDSFMVSSAARRGRESDANESVEESIEMTPMAARRGDVLPSVMVASVPAVVAPLAPVRRHSVVEESVEDPAISESFTNFFGVGEEDSRVEEGDSGSILGGADESIQKSFANMFGVSNGASSIRGFGVKVGQVVQRVKSSAVSVVESSRASSVKRGAPPPPSLASRTESRSSVATASSRGGKPLPSLVGQGRAPSHISLQNVTKTSDSSSNSSSQQTPKAGQQRGMGAAPPLSNLRGSGGVMSEEVRRVQQQVVAPGLEQGREEVVWPRRSTTQRPLPQQPRVVVLERDESQELKDSPPPIRTTTARGKVSDSSYANLVNTAERFLSQSCSSIQVESAGVAAGPKRVRSSYTPPDVSMSRVIDDSELDISGGMFDFSGDDVESGASFCRAGDESSFFGASSGRAGREQQSETFQTAGEDSFIEYEVFVATGNTVSDGSPSREVRGGNGVSVSLGTAGAVGGGGGGLKSGRKPGGARPMIPNSMQR